MISIANCKMSSTRARHCVLYALAVPLALLTGCMLVPVQEMMLKNDAGGSVTCKQTGTGLISSSVGKANFDDCVAKARAAGYK